MATKADRLANVTAAAARRRAPRGASGLRRSTVLTVNSAAERSESRARATAASAAPAELASSTMSSSGRTAPMGDTLAAAEPAASPSLSSPSPLSAASAPGAADAAGTAEAGAPPPAAARRASLALTSAEVTPAGSSPMTSRTAFASLRSTAKRSLAVTGSPDRARQRLGGRSIGRRMSWRTADAASVPASRNSSRRRAATGSVSAGSGGESMSRSSWGSMLARSWLAPSPAASDAAAAPAADAPAAVGCSAWSDAGGLAIDSGTTLGRAEGVGLSTKTSWLPPPVSGSCALGHGTKSSRGPAGSDAAPASMMARYGPPLSFARSPFMVTKKFRCWPWSSRQAKSRRKAASPQPDVALRSCPITERACLRFRDWIALRLLGSAPSRSSEISGTSEGLAKLSPPRSVCLAVTWSTLASRAFLARLKHSPLSMATRRPSADGKVRRVGSAVASTPERRRRVRSTRGSRGSRRQLRQSSTAKRALSCRRNDSCVKASGQPRAARCVAGQRPSVRFGGSTPCWSHCMLTRRTSASSAPRAQKGSEIHSWNVARGTGSLPELPAALSSASSSAWTAGERGSGQLCDGFSLICSSNSVPWKYHASSPSTRYHSRPR
mmetsp:Transcript_9134/g.35724  ORF Transcript_9134/g.35724 Transcript_9134/m.35724 type:complete len:610 (+) Transcript_9134:626-2455(+)